jgi:hypothetical protein
VQYLDAALPTNAGVYGSTSLSSLTTPDFAGCLTWCLSYSWLPCTAAMVTDQCYIYTSYDLTTLASSTGATVAVKPTAPTPTATVNGFAQYTNAALPTDVGVYGSTPLSSLTSPDFAGCLNWCISYSWLPCKAAMVTDRCYIYSSYTLNSVVYQAGTSLALLPPAPTSAGTVSGFMQFNNGALSTGVGQIGNAPLSGLTSPDFAGCIKWCQSYGSACKAAMVTDRCYIFSSYTFSTMVYQAGATLALLPIPVGTINGFTQYNDTALPIATGQIGNSPLSSLTSPDFAGCVKWCQSYGSACKAAMVQGRCYIFSSYTLSTLVYSVGTTLALLPPAPTQAGTVSGFTQYNDGVLPTNVGQIGNTPLSSLTSADFAGCVKWCQSYGSACKAALVTDRCYIFSTYTLSAMTYQAGATLGLIPISVGTINGFSQYNDAAVPTNVAQIGNAPLTSLTSPDFAGCVKWCQSYGSSCKAAMLSGRCYIFSSYTLSTLVIQPGTTLALLPPAPTQAGNVSGFTQYNDGVLPTNVGQIGNTPLSSLTSADFAGCIKWCQSYGSSCKAALVTDRCYIFSSYTLSSMTYQAGATLALIPLPAGTVSGFTQYNDAALPIATGQIGNSPLTSLTSPDFAGCVKWCQSYGASCKAAMVQGRCYIFSSYSFNAVVIQPGTTLALLPPTPTQAGSISGFTQYNDGALPIGSGQIANAPLSSLTSADFAGCVKWCQSYGSSCKAAMVSGRCYIFSSYTLSSMAYQAGATLALLPLPAGTISGFTQYNDAALPTGTGQIGNAPLTSLTSPDFAGCVKWCLSYGAACKAALVQGRCYIFSSYTMSTLTISLGNTVAIKP